MSLNYKRENTGFIVETLDRAERGKVTWLAAGASPSSGPSEMAHILHSVCPNMTKRISLGSFNSIKG